MRAGGRQSSITKPWIILEYFNVSCVSHHTNIEVRLVEWLDVCFLQMAMLGALMWSGWSQEVSDAIAYYPFQELHWDMSNM